MPCETAKATPLGNFEGGVPKGKKNAEPECNYHNRHYPQILAKPLN